MSRSIEIMRNLQLKSDLWAGWQNEHCSEFDIRFLMEKAGFPKGIKTKEISSSVKSLINEFRGIIQSFECLFRLHFPLSPEEKNRVFNLFIQEDKDRITDVDHYMRAEAYTLLFKSMRFFKSEAKLKDVKRNPKVLEKRLTQLFNLAVRESEVINLVKMECVDAFGRDVGGLVADYYLSQMP